MKRMKRVVAVLLVAMMALGITGCSKAEIGYLNLSKEAASMSGMKVDETIMLDFTDDFLKLTGLEKMGNHMEIKMTGEMNQKDMSFDLDLTYRLGNSGQFNPLLRMAMLGDKVYMSSTGVWQIAKTYFAGTQEWSPEFIQEMDAYIAANPMIVVDGNMNQTGDIAALSQEMVAQVSKMYDMLINDHEGFTTGFVTEKDGGYLVKANFTDLIKVMDNWLTFMQKDADSSYKLYNDIMKFAGVSDQEAAQLTKAQWVQGIKELQGEWNKLKGQANKEMALFNNDSYESFSKMTGEKGSRVVSSDYKLSMPSIGITMTGQSTSTEQAVTISPIAKAVDIDDFATGLLTIVDKYTKLDSVVLVPGSDGMGSAQVNTSLFKQTQQDKYQVTMENIDGTYCIEANELNQFSHELKATIDGNKVTLTRGTQKAVLDGVAKDSNCFVKLRDLKEIGLVVEYTANPETITLKVQ